MKIRSYIYSMLAGVAVFTLASCADSVSEFFGLEDKELISFTATAEEEEMGDVTRAAIEEDSRVTKFQNTQPKKPLLLCSSVTERDEAATRGHRVTTADSLKAFRVTAFLTNKNIAPEVFATTEPNFFYNLKAERNANGFFDIEHKYYWPGSNEKLWFYAYTPCDDSNVQISGETATGAQKVSFTVDTDVTKQVDLMTANTETTGFTSASGNTTKTSTPLNFRHELTAIRFVIGEQWLAGSIKSIGIYNVHGRGTMTIGDDEATKWEWKNKAGNAVGAVDDFVLTLNKGGLSGTSGEEFIEDTNLYFLMIPQSFDNNNDAYVEVKYQDNSREYTVRAPLKGQSAWVRNTTVTYAISSHELTKLKIGSITWPDETGTDAFKGVKDAFAAGDEVGLYVVDPDGETITEHHRNVRCSYDGGSWTVHHPEGHPVFKLPGYQYFFYYPYTPTPDTKYPVEGQHNTNTAATAFFSHLIDGWAPAAVQNTQSTLAAQDLQVSKGVDDAQLSSTVNAEMAHQMNMGKLKLGTSKATDTYIYQIDNDHSWYHHPADRDVVASNNFSTNKPYLHSDGYYYFIFKPVESTSDEGTVLKGLDGTAIDWSWEMKSTDHGKILTQTAISADEGKNTVYTDKLVFSPIAALTATGSALTVPTTVRLNNTELTRGTDYAVSFKNANNQSVNAPTVAGNYTAIFTPKGIFYDGDDWSVAFTVNKDGKTITFANTAVAKTYGDAAFTQAVTNTGTGTVTYSSGNTNVATVNSTSGQVTVKAAGTAVITATVQDNEYYSYATKTATYTLTVNKAASTYTAPTAKNLTYSGSAQALVNAGSTSHGTMQYKLSTSSTWSTSIPTATNAGSYTVNYKVVGDANHNDVASKSVAVTINRKALSSTQLKFASATINKTYVWEIRTSSNALTKPSDCTVTYSSNNTGVTSVNSSTGALSPGGTLNTYATITATATGNYSGSASYQIKATTKEVNFGYTGSVQSLAVGPGTYQLQVWGAQGGGVTHTATFIGGYGGYSIGRKSLSSSTTLYVVVGGQGGSSSTSATTVYGGYNGGGTCTGTTAVNHVCAGGGGATHIATASGVLSGLSGNKSAVLIVAGGGGGARDQINHEPAAHWGNGGAGGGTSGGGLNPGTQSSSSGSRTFGAGQSGTGTSGGGGGYYGGGTSDSTSGADGQEGASGGSGYITGLSNASTTAGQRAGHGYARVTWVGN